MASVDERVAKPQNVMLVLGVTRIIQLVECLHQGEEIFKSSRMRTSSKIVTSIILWLKYAGLFLTTLTATISCVFIF